MVEVTQDLDGLLQNAVGLAALHVDYEADAAGLVFVPGVVKTLLAGPPQLTSGAPRKALLSAVVLVLHKRPPKGDTGRPQSVYTEWRAAPPDPELKKSARAEADERTLFGHGAPARAPLDRQYRQDAPIIPVLATGSMQIARCGRVKSTGGGSGGGKRVSVVRFWRLSH